MQYKEKLARFFVKFVGYFLIPVLVMQGVAVFERINAYGLTTPRTVSLVLIIISVLFIVGALAIPKHLNKVALASGIIVLVVTITPFNVIDMPISSQTKILKTVLSDNGMLQDGVVVPNENVSEEDVKRIISAYNYLKYDAQNGPDFIPDSDKSLEEIFGFKQSIKESESNSIYCDFGSKSSVDISGYTRMIEATYDDYVITAEYNNKSYEIDLKQVAKHLYSQYGTEKYDLDVYVVDENTGLYFTNFSFDIEDGEFSHGYFNGYVLFKD